MEIPIQLPGKLSLYDGNTSLSYANVKKIFLEYRYGSEEPRAYSALGKRMKGQWFKAELPLCLKETEAGGLFVETT